MNPTRRADQPDDDGDCLARESQRADNTASILPRRLTLLSVEVLERLVRPVRFAKAWASGGEFRTSARTKGIGGRRVRPRTCCGGRLPAHGRGPRHPAEHPDPAQSDRLAELHCWLWTPAPARISSAHRPPCLRRPALVNLSEHRPALGDVSVEQLAHVLFHRAAVAPGERLERVDGAGRNAPVGEGGLLIPSPACCHHANYN